MAISTSTEALIGVYQQENSRNTEQIQQVDDLEVNGFSITLPDGDPFRIYGVQETLNFFNEPIEKIDARIVELNNKIVGLQNTILAVGQEANNCGCGGSVGFGSTGVPFFLGINTVTVSADTIPFRGYTYTSPNPFAATSGTLTSGNAGVGTEILTGTSVIGSYFGDVGVARTNIDLFPICPGVTECTGYATSITNLSNQISPLQTERNELITKVNFLKGKRSTYEIREYAFENQRAELNSLIANNNAVIDFLQDPANEEWL